MRSIILSAFALTTAACGKSAETCKAEARALTTLLDAIDRDMPPFFLQGDVRLVMRADLPRKEATWGPAIEVGADAVTLRGEVFADREALEEKLRAERELAEERPRAGVDPGFVHLVIDERARWETVIWVAEAAQAADLIHPAFAFARPPAAVPPPPPSNVDAELERIKTSEAPANKAEKLAELTSKVVNGCPALVRAFGSVPESGEDTAARVIGALEPALVACNCSLDMPSLTSIMYRLFLIEHPVTALDLVLAADGRPVTAPAGAAWSEVAAKLPIGGGAVRFGIAP